LGDSIGLAGAIAKLAEASKLSRYEQTLEAMARELAQVGDKERRKLAEQLHDEFGQDLILVKLKLDMLFDALPAEYRERLAEIGNIVVGLIGNTRTVIQQLHPPYVCEIGLRAALRALAEDMEQRHGLRCAVKLSLAPRPQNEEVQQVLYRTVRELLTNVVKHAQASRARIVLRYKADLMIVEICDDGKGFVGCKSTFSDLKTKQFGLFSIRAALAPLRGSLRIVSTPGRGTRAIVSLPVGTH